MLILGYISARVVKWTKKLYVLSNVRVHARGRFAVYLPCGNLLYTQIINCTVRKLFKTISKEKVFLQKKIKSITVECVEM